MPVLLQTLLYPQHGRWTEVINDVVDLRESENMNTNVSVSLAMPLIDNRHIAVHANFQNPDELEERMGQITPEFNAKHAQIHAKCSDVKRNILIVNEIPEGAPDNPKFIARRTFIAKRGKRDSLLEYLKEGRANQEQKPLVMIPLGGDTDVIRMSLYFTSLSDVVNAYERTIGPDNSGVRAKIADLTEKSYISLHRVISRIRN